jgi:hypothetical protein
LRIAWFTSVTAEGDAAEYSRWVLGAMAQLCEPCLCCTQPPHGFPVTVPVVNLGSDPEALWDLGPLDAVFYVIGNDVRQHAWTFEMARTHPGIVVLLDPTLHLFFLDYYVRHLRRTDLYLTRMAEHYGLEGLVAAHRILGPSRDAAGARPEDRELRRYTFTEEALRLATAAVVHSPWHAALTTRAWNGPVYETRLPAAAGTGLESEPGAVQYAEGLLRFAEQHCLPHAADYFALSASRGVAERMAIQIGHTLGSLGAKPGSQQVEALITEAARLLPPPSR